MPKRDVRSVCNNAMSCPATRWRANRDHLDEQEDSQADPVPPNNDDGAFSSRLHRRLASQSGLNDGEMLNGESSLPQVETPNKKMMIVRRHMSCVTSATFAMHGERQNGYPLSALVPTGAGGFQHS